ncbi:MAG TPA: serine/threonine-protein kinase [Terracidiphilus sp.]|nr:serine/threonine-protein kinase [Terracidiphilus sp.]
MPVDSNLDKRRVTEAMRRGWVRQQQVEECLLELNTADSIVGALARRGWLTAQQVDELCGGAGPRITQRDSGVAGQGGPTVEVHGSGKLDPQDVADVLGEGDVIAERYLIEQIRRGGFGRVYLCTDIISGKRAALKTLLREHLGSGRLLEMFHREILLWIQLGDHPNIVLAYGLEDFMRLPFVVMECVDGGSLEDLVEQGALSWREAANFGWQIANGLEHARQVCGLIHRDLKPANVLLTREGVAKVTDFGISLVRGAAGEQMAGTPGYMAPEQWDRPAEVDVRSDVYAFGVTLFELACGRRPFPDYPEERFSEYRTDQQTKMPPDPRQFQPEIPESMARLILHCLEKRQDRRPANFSAIKRELEPLAGPRPAAFSDVPDRVGGLVNQSKTYGLLGRTEDALRTAREAVRVAPGDANAHVALGNALARQGNFTEAFRESEQAHRLDRANPMAIVNSALYADLAGERATAKVWADRAIASVDPQHLQGVASLLIDFGRVPEAIDLCNTIVAANPLAIVAWNHLAIALRRSGELDRALECAIRAVEINPRYAKGWSNRATILAQLGRFEDAIVSADRALEFESATAGAYAAKAAALGHLGRIAEAQACVERGLQIMPGNSLLMRAMAQFQ